MSQDIPSEKDKIQPETLGTVRRKLPRVRTVSEGLEKSKAKSEDSHPPQDPTQAKAMLAKYNTKILERLREVNEMFKEAPRSVSPTENAEFTDFIQGQLAYANMYYVVFGRFPEDADNISGEGNPLVVNGNQFPLPPGLDPALSRHPAVQAALAEGATLTGEEDNL